MRQKKQNKPSLDVQAEITANAAESAVGYEKNILSVASESLRSQAKREAAIAKRKQNVADPVLELPEAASEPEVKKARRFQAVKTGQQVFLPSWSDLAFGLPNALLRSNMWTSAPLNKLPKEPLIAKTLITLSDKVKVTYSGPQLTMYDQLVFALCLESYRDRPLSSTGDTNNYITTSFYRFAQALGVAYGENTHTAIRDSLLRLWGANLRLITGRYDIPVPRLLEVVFVRSQRAESDDAWAECADYGSMAPADLLPSDVIKFRMTDKLAALYGPAEWSAVPKLAFDEGNGLKGFIARFYSTHSKPYPLPLEDLRTYSGVTVANANFKRILTNALDALKDESVDLDIRVDSYVITAKHVLVFMSKWNTSPAQRDAAMAFLQTMADSAAAKARKARAVGLIPEKKASTIRRTVTA